MQWTGGFTDIGVPMSFPLAALSWENFNISNNTLRYDQIPAKYHHVRIVSEHVSMLTLVQPLRAASMRQVRPGM